MDTQAPVARPSTRISQIRRSGFISRNTPITNPAPMPTSMGLAVTASKPKNSASTMTRTLNSSQRAALPKSTLRTRFENFSPVTCMPNFQLSVDRAHRKVPDTHWLKQHRIVLDSYYDQTPTPAREMPDQPQSASSRWQCHLAYGSPADHSRLPE